MSTWHWTSIKPVWAASACVRVCVYVCMCDLVWVSPGTGAGWLTVPKLSPDIDSERYTFTIDTLTDRAPSVHLSIKNTLRGTLNPTPNYIRLVSLDWIMLQSNIFLEILLVTPGIGFVFRKYLLIELSSKKHLGLLRLQWFHWQHCAFKSQATTVLQCYSFCLHLLKHCLCSWIFQVEGIA